MATKTSVVLVDDLTDEAADTTVSFGLDGRDYEIDLTEANASKLREVLSCYVNAARKISKSGRPLTRTQARPDPAAVRAWAKANGIEVNERGRIKAEVVEQYRAARN